MGGVGGDGGNGGSSTSGGQESDGGNGGAGYGDGQGGGIYCDGASSPKVIDCMFINNVARCARGGPGGAVGSGQARDPRAQPGVLGLTIPYGNVSGGAAYYATNTDPNFINCTFTKNKAFNAYSASDEHMRDAEALIDTRGGALYAEPGNTVTLQNCQFVENYGGAVYVESGCKVDVNDLSV